MATNKRNRTANPLPCSEHTRERSELQTPTIVSQNQHNFERFESLDDVSKLRVLSFLDERDIMSCRLASKSMKSLSDETLREKHKVVTINLYWNIDKITSILNLYRRASTLIVVSNVAALTRRTPEADRALSENEAFDVINENLRNRAHLVHIYGEQYYSESPLRLETLINLLSLLSLKSDAPTVARANSSSATENALRVHDGTGATMAQAITQLIVDYDSDVKITEYVAFTDSIVTALEKGMPKLRRVALSGPYNDRDVERILTRYSETLRTFSLTCSGRENRFRVRYVPIRDDRGEILYETEADFHGEIAFAKLRDCTQLFALSLDNAVDAMRSFGAIPDVAALNLTSLRLVCAEEATGDQRYSRIKSFIDVEAIASKCKNLVSLSVGALKIVNLAIGILQLVRIERLEIVLRYDPNDDLDVIDDVEQLAGDAIFDENESSDDDYVDTDDDDDDSSASSSSLTTDGDSSNLSETSSELTLLNDADYDVEVKNALAKTNENDSVIISRARDENDIQRDYQHDVAQVEIGKIVNNYVEAELLNEEIEPINENENVHDDNFHQLEAHHDNALRMGIFVDEDRNKINENFNFGASNIREIHLVARNGSSPLLRRLLEEAVLEYIFSTPATGTNTASRNLFTERLCGHVRRVCVSYDLYGSNPVVTRRLLRQMSTSFRKSETRSIEMPVLRLNAYIGFYYTKQMRNWYAKFATLLHYAAVYFTETVECYLHVADDVLSAGFVKTSELDYVTRAVELSNNSRVRKDTVREAYQRKGKKPKLLGFIKFDIRTHSY